MTLEQMESAIGYIRARFPRATLVRNLVGNLAILNEKNEFVGWIDISDGQVYWEGDVP